MFERIAIQSHIHDSVSEHTFIHPQRSRIATPVAPRVSLAKAPVATVARAPKASAITSRAPRINLDKALPSVQVLCWGRWVTIPAQSHTAATWPIEQVRALPFGEQPYIRRSTLHV